MDFIVDMFNFITFHQTIIYEIPIMYLAEWKTRNKKRNPKEGILSHFDDEAFFRQLSKRIKKARKE